MTPSVTPDTTPPLDWLAEQLRQRLAIVADHAWRDRDPAGHLEALKTVSLSVLGFHSEWGSRLDRQLEHFLANGSYVKALAYLDEETERAKCRH